MNTQAALKAVATGQQTAQEARNPYQQFKDQLERTKPQLLGLMGGSRQNVEQFCSVLDRAVLANMDLLSADRRSLIAAALKCAQDGLLPDGREAVLNIRNTKVKRGTEWVWTNLVVYEPMVAGYIKNLYEHPDVELVDAAAVFQNDHFKFVRGDSPRLEHEPCLDDEPGALKCAYLVVRLKNGQIKREVMPLRDIEKVKAVSKAQGDNSPWAKWPDQMAIKSVIKRGAKQLPRSNKFEQMDQHDNEAHTVASEGAAAAVLGTQPVEPTPAAIQHQPGEILEMPGTQPEAVHVGGEDDHDHQQQEQQQAGQEQQLADSAPKVTYTQLLTRLNKTKDRDVATLILDEGRALTQEEQVALKAAFDKRFPPQE